MYIRSLYLQQLSNLSWKWVISILVGMRRIGKSTILQQYMDHVWVENCLYIQKELHMFEAIHNHIQLYDYIQAHIGQKQYILVDEVQLISWWEKTINGLLAQYGTQKDIIITGSNSDLLSTEISTLLRGRTFEIMVYPFSFSEYTNYLHKDANMESFKEFLWQWWMPSLYMMDQNQQNIWMEWLINTVFLKDIVGRYAIRDVDLLRSIFLYIVNTTSDQCNLTNIKNYLIQQWYTINLNTLGSYVVYLINSLLIQQIDMYDIQWKKILDRMRKFYTTDHAIRRYLFAWFYSGMGKLLENYVYISLCRWWYKVTVGRLWTKEIDFIAQKNNKKIYVQVSYILTDENVISREFGPLKALKDHRPKYVVSLDPMSVGIIDGIQHIQAWDRENVL